jgi:hypothetical protein
LRAGGERGGTTDGGDDVGGHGGNGDAGCGADFSRGALQCLRTAGHERHVHAFAREGQGAPTAEAFT